MLLDQVSTSYVVFHIPFGALVISNLVIMHLLNFLVELRLLGSLRVMMLGVYFILKCLWCLKAKHASGVITWGQSRILILEYQVPLFIPLGLKIANTNISTPFYLGNLEPEGCCISAHL